MAEAKSNTFEIEFLGQKMVFKTETDSDLTKETVELAMVRIREAERRCKAGKMVAPHQIALLALLELSEEYIRARQRTAEYRRDLASKAEKLNGILEQF